MDGVAHHFLPFCPVILGNDDGGTGRKSYEETDQQIDDGASGSAYRRQSLLAHKPADNDGVYGVVKLLEKGSK